MVPFDYYSDYLRGTMGASLDLYEEPEAVLEFVQQQAEIGVKALEDLQWARPGNIVEIFMHKGMDGFLSKEHYATFYWEPFMRIVDAIIKKGMIPYLFTEGPYSSRLEFLKQLPPAKCLVHFEKIDIAWAKRELQDVACVTGNFSGWLLESGTPNEVKESVKQLMDDCAEGGGYMLAFDSGMYAGKRANVEALYEAVREYGRYR
jgi:uroporphyrinogen-III decarboxylase